jgi:hypothetical protein
VIGVELGRDNHDSIPITTIGRGLEPHDTRTDPEPNSTGTVKTKNKRNIQVVGT